jgi:hypothetical protein
VTPWARVWTIRTSPARLAFLKHYPGQFKYAVTKEEHELVPKKRFQLDGGGSGFTQMVRNFAAPGDWKALRRYIAQFPVFLTPLPLTPAGNIVWRSVVKIVGTLVGNPGKFRRLQGIRQCGLVSIKK